MSNTLALKNLKKHARTYGIYFFSISFSVALYFAFVTLRYAPAMEAVEESTRGSAGIGTASVLLFFILAFFLLYANNLMIKRRSQELGLLQLIGMTKSRVFQLISIEIMYLYLVSLMIGIIAGFLLAKLVTMMLLNIIGVEEIVSLYFSSTALFQTVLVFLGIYLIVVVANALFLKRHTVLQLFHFRKRTEIVVKKLSGWEIITGIVGIALIVSGYYVSTILLSDTFGGSPSVLFLGMGYTLGSVIIGTYLSYRGSVSLLAKIVRKKQAGYMSVVKVLSLSSIMFRMKSSALLLTIITTVSALAIGLLSLSYISYYSANQNAAFNAPNHFGFLEEQDRNEMITFLDEEGLTYSLHDIEVKGLYVDLEDLLEYERDDLYVNPREMFLPVVSDEDVDGVTVQAGDVFLTPMAPMLEVFMQFKDTGDITIFNDDDHYNLKYIGKKEEPVVNYILSIGGLSTLIVADEVYQELNSVEDIRTEFAINIEDDADLEAANDWFMDHNESFRGLAIGQLASEQEQKQQMGLVMFIVGFLGFAFLFTSGCILYIKQMDESEADRPDYTILRKLGFTNQDLLKGIKVRQLYNFGIPLLIGLLHSYFAVRSGWFIFGNEMHIPMLIVMTLYTVLYSVFGILSVSHSKKIIRDSL
ncbi:MULTISPECIES: ABC transporter permease [Bacillaceae]|uniref:Bacitracin ABC transporter permease n=1 Tax=Alkalicoccobacillus plakortidis TaxID=444060 RepID=A0A9D5DV19_9BACI|nr:MULTISPECIES: ABC transporter permease [Bacillaceae]KQL57342.1 bacitracin ABC transporter permease [Alkalicoccobacillus plakortidis]